MKICYHEYFGALDEAVFRYIGENAENGGLLVLVPSSASFLMERQIVQNCAADGFMDIEVLSFEKLTERVLACCGGRRDGVIDRTGVVMMTKRASEAAEGRLRVLGAAQDPTLPEAVAELISAAKAEGLFAEELNAVAEQTGGAAGEKLRDVAEIARTLAKMMDGRPDREDMAAAASKLSGGFVRGKKVVVHGFDVFSRRMIETVAEIAAAADDVFVTLGMEKDNEIYKKQELYGKLLEEAAASRGRETQWERAADVPFAAEDIKHLFDNAMCYSYRAYGGQDRGFSAGRAADREAEVRMAAREILKEVERGTKLSDIGLLVGNKADYDRLLAEEFGAAEINYFLEDKRSLGESRAAVFVLSALDVLAGGWAMTDVLRHIKTGYLPVERDEADALIEYAAGRELYGTAMKRAIKDEKIESIRARAFEPLLGFDRKKEPAREILAYLERTELEKRLEQEAEEMAQAGLTKEAAFHAQLYEKLAALLGQAAAFGDTMSLRELREMIAFGMESVNIAVVPPTVDQVVAGDLTHSIFPRKRLMVILGMNDGMIPFVPDTAGLINASEMRALKEVCPTFPDKLTFEDQKIYIRKAIAGGDRLYVTCNEKDGGASYMLNRLLRLTGQELSTEKSVAVHAKGAALAYTAREMRRCADGDDGADLSSLPAYAKDVQDDLESLLYALDYKNGAEPLGKELAERLYGQATGSVSRLESYFACPYRHFITYGLRPRERQELDEDARNVGTYVHSILDHVAREMKRRGANWRDADDALLDRLIEQERDREREAHNGGIFAMKRYRMSEKHLTERIAMAARAVRNQLPRDARVLGTEVRFEGENAYRIETALGSVALRGVIDRVDITEGAQNEYIRIVDYKTGDKRFDVTEFACGLELQLVIYMMAALMCYRERGVKPGGAFYFTIGSPVVDAEVPDEKRLSDMALSGFASGDSGFAESLDSGAARAMRIGIVLDEATGEKQVKPAENVFGEEELNGLIAYAEKLAKKAVEGIYTGDNAISPAVRKKKSQCDRCGYRSICRFDEAYPANAGREITEVSREQLIRREGSDSEDD